MNESRRIFCYSIAMSLASGLELHANFLTDNVSERIRAMVDRARAYLRSTDWAPRESFGPLEKAFYCNVFVADIAREAGIATWDPIRRTTIIPLFRDPLAQEWQNPNFFIKGWSVIYSEANAKDQSAGQILALRKPGDVVSDGKHCGIVSDDKGSFRGRVFSASAITGAIELNDWSFRYPDQAGYHSAAEFEAAAKARVSIYTVRRFIGV